jgi:mannan endo-1,4-beta-mannosidase
MTARIGLINWLHSISGQYILTGQTSHADGNEIDANTRDLGFSLAIDFYDPWLVSTDFNDSFFDRSMQHFNAGGMVGISITMPNPLTNNRSADGIYAEYMVTNWNDPQNIALRAQLDKVATLFKKYKATTPKPLYFRPYFEMDGWWSWWGTNVFTPEHFINLWRFTWWYLTVFHQLDNILWTWGPNGGPGTYMDRYPGDDVVDIVGFSSYTNNLDADCWRIYNNLVALAPNKLFALTERGSGSPNGQDHNFDAGQLYIEIKKWMPRFIYVNYWCGWGPNGEKNAKTALKAPYILNRP